MLCFPQYLCNIDLAVLDIPHFLACWQGFTRALQGFLGSIAFSLAIEPKLCCGANSRVRLQPQKAIFLHVLLLGMLNCWRHNPFHFCVAMLDLAGWWYTTRRTQEFPCSAPRTSFKFGIFHRSVHRTHLAVLQCWIVQFFSQSPCLKINFLCVFFPLARDRDAFPQPHFSEDLRSATDALAKKTPPCPGKSTPFPGRGLFWHPTRWQKNTFGDAWAFSRQQSCWQKSSFGDARPFPGWPQKLAEKNPALAKKHPVPCEPGCLVELSNQANWAEVLRRGCERVFWVSGEGVPRRSLAPVRDGVCTVRKWDFEVLHRCERLFRDTLARDPKHPLALSPKHFWSICLIWQLYQGARLAIHDPLSMYFSCWDGCRRETMASASLHQSFVRLSCASLRTLLGICVVHGAPALKSKQLSSSFFLGFRTLRPASLILWWAIHWECPNDPWP